MRFYQKISFRFILGAVFLVTSVAGLLVWRIQELSREVLRKTEYATLFDEANLRFREVPADIQALREDLIVLSNVSQVRRLQWALQYKNKDIAVAPPGFDDPDKFLASGLHDAKNYFDQLLDRRKRYLRLEYYLQHDDLRRPELVCSRAGFPDQAGRPLSADDLLIERTRNRDTWTDVSFSQLQVWPGDGTRPMVVLQARVRVVFSDPKRPPGLLVATIDFQPWARALSRSPRHLVFLAGGDKRLLLYPRPGRPADSVLTAEDAAVEERKRFTEEWLTNEKGLQQQDASFSLTLAVRYRYAPGTGPDGHGDDEWKPSDLRCLLLRARIAERALTDPERRQALTQALRDLQKQYPNLVVEPEINPAREEISIRGWTEDTQQLDEVRQALTRHFPSDIRFLDTRPLLCTRFVRTLYKFSLSPRGPLSEQCLYIALATPIEAIEARIDDNWPSIRGWVVACVLGAISVAVVGSILLTRPLNAITAATQQLAAGNTEVRVPVSDPTEIGVLARSFAFMVGQIQQRQNEVAERQARLQTILDSAADAILTFGADGTLQSFNRAAERLFGYAAAEILGQHLNRLFEDPCLSATDAEATQRLAARLGPGQTGECLGRRKDGSTFPLEYGGNRVPLENRTLLTLIVRDITWRKEAEEAARRRNEELERHVQERTRALQAANMELAEARDKAEQVAVAKDYFLATVSHELRTPLNHVLGFIGLLEMTPLAEDQQRDLSKIHGAADNLLSLVNDILDYQKMIQGVLTLEPTRFDLAPWVEELADAMRPKAAERGNRLVVDCPADIGCLDADEQRVRQALTNLLGNAAKFTRDGVITLRVSRERTSTNACVRLDVQDTGRGISPAQQAKLFQPFTKLLTRSENPEGTGLGLALSQRLCRLLGGDLSLSSSEPGQGSTFTIRLPAPETGAQTRAWALRALAFPEPGVREQPVPTSKATSVLVIDDDPDVRELMRRYLEEQGFVVHLAASGAEGLEMVKGLRPDAITLDILMPGIDGWGTLAALQADVETARIPVILITLLDDRTRGFALGAWEVLPKPINWSRLLDLLRHIKVTPGPVLLVDPEPALRRQVGQTLSQHGWEVCFAEDGRTALVVAAHRCPSVVLLNLVKPPEDAFAFLEAFRLDSNWREVPVIVLTSLELSDEDRGRLGRLVQRILPKGMGSLDELLREVEWLLHYQSPGSVPEALAPQQPVSPEGGKGHAEGSGSR